jgi:hypothetical protein
MAGLLYDGAPKAFPTPPPPPLLNVSTYLHKQVYAITYKPTRVRGITGQ